MNVPPDMVVVPRELWLELGAAIAAARLDVLLAAGASGDLARLRSRILGPIERAHGLIVDLSSGQDQLARPGG